MPLFPQKILRQFSSPNILWARLVCLLLHDKSMAIPACKVTEHLCVTHWLKKWWCSGKAFLRLEAELLERTTGMSKELPEFLLHVGAISSWHRGGRNWPVQQRGRVPSKQKWEQTSEEMTARSCYTCLLLFIICVCLLWRNLCHCRFCFYTIRG